jgi:hypothetical protein
MDKPCNRAHGHSHTAGIADGVMTYNYLDEQGSVGAANAAEAPS